jgi:hypothetical protein
MKLIEWAGSLFGVSAAILLALNVSISGWAYILYLLSSLFLAFWAYRQKAYGVAFQNLVFIAINVMGIYRWLIVPV